MRATAGFSVSQLLRSSGALLCHMECWAFRTSPPQLASLRDWHSLQRYQDVKHGIQQAPALLWAQHTPLQQARGTLPGHHWTRGFTSDNHTGNALLSNTTSFLRNLDNGAEIFLVGTAHVSRRSAEEVREMVRLVKPDVVMVELCAGRAGRLRAGQSTSEMDFFKEALSLLPGGMASGAGKGFGETLFKMSMQGLYRFLKSLGMDPGGEFKVAMEEADRVGARVVYGDRDMQDTLGRLSAALSLQDVLRMLSGGMQPPSQALVDFFNGSTGGSFESQVEAMKTRAMAREMSLYMRQINPQLAAALIDERDEFMVEKLRQLEGRVVGVVGLAHLDGIERRWEQRQLGQQAVVKPGY